MFRIAALLIPLTFAPSLQAQDEELLARGQKYLDKVAGVWEKDLPVKRVIGIYLGRRWTGHMRLTVKAAPKGMGAVFEVNLVGTAKVMDQTFRGRGQILLARDLSPVKVEFLSEQPDKKERKTLTAEGGTWRMRHEQNGEVSFTEGDVKPGTTWGAAMLPLFAIPDDDKLKLISLDRDKSPFEFRRLPDRRERRIGANVAAYRVLELDKGDGLSDLCFFADDGRVVEIASGGATVRMRPVEEARMNLDLDEPLLLKPAERALVDLFLAIRRNDREAVVGAFDIERLCAESMPGFDELDEEQKKEMIDRMPEQIEARLLSEAMRRSLPEEGLLEDMLAAGMKTRELVDVAYVEVFERQIWKLYRAEDGERKGRWLIIGVAQKEP